MRMTQTQPVDILLTWLKKNSNLIISHRTKVKLYLKWRRNSKNTNMKNTYKNYFKIFDKVIEQAKYINERETFRAAKNNCEKIWQLINDRIDKNKNIKRSNVEYIIERAKNKFFSGIGPELAEKIVEPVNTNLRMPIHNVFTIFLREIDTNELISKIIELKVKAGGIDGISAKVLESLARFIKAPLKYISIYVFRIKHGQMPLKWQK